MRPIDERPWLYMTAFAASRLLSDEQGSRLALRKAERQIEFYGSHARIAVQQRSARAVAAYEPILRYWYAVHHWILRAEARK